MRKVPRLVENAHGTPVYILVDDGPLNQLEPTESLEKTLSQREGYRTVSAAEAMERITPLLPAGERDDDPVPSDGDGDEKAGGPAPSEGPA